MSHLERTLQWMERAVTWCCVVSACLLIPTMIAARAGDIVARQFVSTPANYLQALENRAFLFLVLLGLGYAYLRDSHVRVDILRERLSRRAKAWIELFGFVFALLPVCIVTIMYGAEYAHQSYLDGEREWVALGRPLRWVAKGMLPFGASLLLLAGIVVSTRNVLFLLGVAPEGAPGDDEPPDSSGQAS